MKKTLIGIILVVLIIAVFSAPVNNSAIPEIPETSQSSFGAGPVAVAPAVAIRHEEEEPSVERYLVKDYKGKLAIFTDVHQVMPDMVTEIMTATLRNNDKAALENGIWVNGLDGVAALLEDLGS